MRKSIRATYLVTAALITWVALSLHFALTLERSLAHGGAVLGAVALYFSFFTILTNLLAALVLTGAAIGWREASRPGIAAAITVYLCIVGGVYLVLLRNPYGPYDLQFAADATLHYATPVLFGFYWLVFVRKGSLKWRAPFVWLLYPVAYLAFSLLRGAMTGFYLYPFLNVAALGYPRVLASSLLLMVIFLGLGFGAVAIDRMSALSRPETR
jgi:hypothetical protein